MLPCIFGLKGLRLDREERHFFEANQPFGFILFARNIQSPEQVAGLVDDLKACVGHTPFLTIDQEGGRVARLKPPHWPELLSIASLCQKGDDAQIADRIAMHSQLIAGEIKALGLNSSCYPVLDIPQADADEIIGDRAFSGGPQMVAKFGRVAAEVLLQAGVLPVIKHIPGHGRAMIDSHLALPRVSASRAELASDFSPFKALKDMPLAMTAHIAYEAYDKHRPATMSRPVIKDVIRGAIGFSGLLMTDDLSMKALDGSFADRTRFSLTAGVDIILHCNGDMTEMQEIADACDDIKDEQAGRFHATMKLTESGKKLDLQGIRSDYAAMIADLRKSLP